MDFVIRTGIDSDKFLREWRWLVPTAQVVLVTPLGDMILYIDGEYWFLDCSAAKLEQIAPTKQELETVLERRADELLATSLVERFVEQGFEMMPGKCISFYPPIVLQGEYRVENARAIDAVECVSFLGDVNRQLKDSPDGTRVQLKVME
jgi:hypothetical protein